MDSVIAFLANYLLWIIVAGAGFVWLFREDRHGRIELALAGVLGLLLTLGLITIATHVHVDPRPFVVNHSLHPLISHSADNGFPSDHSAGAALIAVLIWLRHRIWGIVLAAAAILVGVARVAAHVHHVQDVAAGWAIGGFAAVIATVLIHRVTAARPAIVGR